MAYPKKVAVKAANARTLRYVQETSARHVAEIGIYEGHTSLAIAKILPADGSLTLFDFEDRTRKVAAAARKVAKCKVLPYGNSTKLRDSYCWSLMQLLRRPTPPRWDYVFIDGAHTWAVDGFAFLLCDRMLAPGGFVDFDDYDWTLAKSPSLNPRAFPHTAREYTPAQIASAQIRLVCDVLVRPMGYVEVAKNKLFQKPL